MLRRRLVLIWALLYTPLLLVGLRAFHLQVLRGDHYQGRAAYRARRARFLPPMRGRLLDRRGRVLAESKPVLDLTARPDEVDLEYGLSERLATALTQPRDEIVRTLRRAIASRRSGPDGTVTVIRAPRRTIRAVVRRYPCAREIRPPDGSRRESLLALPPEEIDRHRSTIADLASLLSVPAARLTQRLENEESRIDAYTKADRRLAEGRRPFPLAQDVPLSAAARVEEDPEGFPGVSVEPRQERRYPSGEAANQAIGGLGAILPDQERELRENRLLLDLRHDIIDPDDFTEIRKDAYLLSDRVGRDGLERALEARLRGMFGLRLEERDRAGRLNETIYVEPPLHGQDVRLTIDLAIQAEAERTLDETVFHMASDPAASGAACVLMDIHDGSILAMATSPRAHRGDIRRDYASLVQDPAAPLLDRATRGERFPGSVFKIVTALAALESGAITPSATVRCSGRYTRWKVGFRCDGVHGDVNVTEALKRSCNVFFFEMGHRLGREGLTDWARWLGFGARTGIDLFPLDRPGRFPTPEWKREMMGEPWYPGDTWNTAVGQGDLLVTPLQVARLLASVANGGQLIRPRLVLDGPVPPALPLGIHPENLALVRDALRRVVAEPGGTAYRVRELRRAGGGAAGKTGTAQAGRRGSHAWFAAYAPHDHPEVAVAACVEHVGPGHHGADAAGPIVARVLAAWEKAKKETR